MYFASLKLAGYLKLSTPSIVAAARIADSYDLKCKVQHQL